MFGRRRLRVGYGEQTVRETKRNADAFETPTLLDDEVRQPGMTNTFVNQNGQLVIYPHAMEVSASVIGVGAA